MSEVPDLSSFPRAPSAEAWAAMSPAERQRVVEALPQSVTEFELSPPEGDAHRSAKTDAYDELTGFFERDPRGVYIGSELTVYYPDAQRFCPDLFVVFDVLPGPRDRWVVSAEGKGLDFVLEVHVGGDRRKDAERNVALYAQVGIPEYFIFDRRRSTLSGHRLVPGTQRYQPILAQFGRYESRSLGLELALENRDLVFYHRNSQLLGPRALIQKLKQTVDSLAASRDEDAARVAAAEAEKAAAEAERAAAEAERAAAEAERAAAEAERAAAEARVAELERRLRALGAPTE